LLPGTWLAIKTGFAGCLRLTRLFGTPNPKPSETRADDFVARYEAQQQAAEAVASVDGKHYTDHVEDVKALKREGKLEEAEALLLRLVASTEAESEVTGLGVAPWYYEQLAIVYRKLGRNSEERQILERYARQKKAPGAKPAKLDERLKALGPPPTEA
jgi:hypothetical protein